MRRRLALLLASTCASCLLAAAAVAQDSNILFPIDSIEHRLVREHFEIEARQDARFQGDRTQRTVLTFPDQTTYMVKWARAPVGGQQFNNEPRYELAAYQIQKLFLDGPEYVVPPTIARAFPLAWYREFDSAAQPTFDGARSILVVLQYWLSNVSQRDVFDAERLRTDDAYARHFANLNILTFLIRHSDSNAGNVLISQDSLRPRLFSVDNGVAFASQESDRGTAWRRLRVGRLPRETVERLRQIQREDLHQALGVVSQFEIRDGELVPVPPTANLSAGRGIRRRGDVVQLGLTSREINQVHDRLRQLLRQVDSGRLTTF
jgi:hypothetical protein